MGFLSAKEEKVPEPQASPDLACAIETGDPADFAPGLLFDASATWVMFVRRLLVPAYYRNKGEPDATCPPPPEAECDCGCPKKKKKAKKKSFWSC